MKEFTSLKALSVHKKEKATQNVSPRFIRKALEKGDAIVVLCQIFGIKEKKKGPGRKVNLHLFSSWSDSFHNIHLCRGESLHFLIHSTKSPADNSFVRLYVGDLELCIRENVQDFRPKSGIHWWLFTSWKGPQVGHSIHFILRELLEKPKRKDKVFC